MSNGTRLFHCDHATITRRTGPHPITLVVRRGNVCGGFSVSSLAKLREKIEEDVDDGGLICPCLHAWAASDSCFWCVDAVPVEAHDGYPTCEDCAQAFREGTRCHAPRCCKCGAEIPDESVDRCAACLEFEVTMANIRTSLDYIAESRALGIEPASVLKAVRDYSKKGVVIR